MHVPCEQLLKLAKRSRDHSNSKTSHQADSVHMMQRVVPGAFNNEQLSDNVSIHSSQSGTSLHDPLTKSDSFANLTIDEKQNTDGSHDGESAMVDSEMNDSQDSDTDSSAGSRLRRSGSLCKKGSRMESPVIGVARALGETQYSEEVLRKVNQYKVGI